ncbi:ABC-type antimicrobial peptide transport system permease subunit [Pseudoduganella flava]|uniref:ABC-type antimicrobial peptide transport system permease subunit n=1 Tax=Pseudoduganella flava TaxID=871742 RepID=A0A562PDA4_9BURK|nr:FtsX-like permease family protein [Pseudoduganella flava]QGZ40054.1 FtsX-like permease family protein [Pseudoduganella flava]TWI42200.1 ABC-type antimicrobial peptide transport system permease subunit [Pseudoduganella flava]
MAWFDFRVGWRALARRPLQAVTMLAGLAVALAAAFLLLGFVHYSFSYDSTVPDNRNVYVFKHRLNLLAQPQWVEQMPLPAYEVLANSGLPLTLCSVLPHRETLQLGGTWRDITFTEVSDTFPALFGVRATEGDLAAVLARPDGLALTPAGALALFGTANALGRTVRVSGAALRVLALLPEPPPNTTVTYMALVGTKTALWAPGGRDRMRKEWMALAGKLFVKMGPGVQPEAARALMQREAERVTAQLVGADTVRRLGTVVEVGITPLADAYFDTSVAAFHGGPRAAKAGVLALAALAVLILVLAATNYVNLATLRVLERAREIAIRKTLGAGTGRLATQFMTESVVAALAATAAGLLLAWLLLPVFAGLMDRPLAAVLSPATVLAAVALGLAVGLVCGIWPARLALRVLPGQALSGRAGSEPGGAWLRRALTVFQFAAAIALCALALAIGWQARYAAQADPGFALDDYHVLRMPEAAPKETKLAFRAALARVPDVAGATTIDQAFGDPAIPMSAAFRREGGDERRIDMVMAGPQFFATTRVKPLAGRTFDAARPALPQARDVMLNESAALALGFASGAAAVGQAIGGPAEGPLRIVGIVPPLRHKDLRQAPRPLVYMVDQGDANVLLMRSALGAEALENGLAPLWRHYFPGHPLAVRPARAAFEDSGADDRRAARLLTLGCLVATGIAASGIYALAAAGVRKRGREIVLRKLHGASRGAIALLVGTEFALLLLAAGALALPPSALAIARYLAGFSSASTATWWALPAALALGALVALAATLRHALTALRLSPAAALRQG